MNTDESRNISFQEFNVIWQVKETKISRRTDGIYKCTGTKRKRVKLDDGSALLHSIIFSQKVDITFFADMFKEVKGIDE